MSNQKFIESVLEQVETNIERRHLENMKGYYNKLLHEITIEDLEKLKLKKQALVISRDIIAEVLKETIGRI